MQYTRVNLTDFTLNTSFKSISFADFRQSRGHSLLRVHVPLGPEPEMLRMPCLTFEWKQFFWLQSLTPPTIKFKPRPQDRWARDPVPVLSHLLLS